MIWIAYATTIKGYEDESFVIGVTIAREDAEQLCKDYTTIDIRVRYFTIEQWWPGSTQWETAFFCDKFKFIWVPIEEKEEPWKDTETLF